ncbi:MAG: BcrAD BadFG protein [Ignavibacteria bacterium]|nr:BcrAD BadFG protein [Ignavibacteria bacterium]
MEHFLGIDAGSSFTKFTVIDENKKELFNTIAKTLTRNKDEIKKIYENINKEFSIRAIGATGYGRQIYKIADVIKTELYCSSTGITEKFPIDKTIVDIGGEDVKVIKSSSKGKIMDFYLNSKCAAGTGSFIIEISERAEIPVSEMNELARKSHTNKELNSFCTVFAKTEVMQWIFDDVSIEDISKGIYVSIVNRIKKIPMDKSLPVILIGGVAHYHPYLRELMEESMGMEVFLPEKPQYINSYGAAIFAFLKR